MMHRREFYMGGTNRDWIRRQQSNITAEASARTPQITSDRKPTHTHITQSKCIGSYI